MHSSLMIGSHMGTPSDGIWNDISIAAVQVVLDGNFINALLQSKYAVCRSFVPACASASLNMYSSASPTQEHLKQSLKLNIIITIPAEKMVAFFLGRTIDTAIVHTH